MNSIAGKAAAACLILFAVGICGGAQAGTSRLHPSTHSSAQTHGDQTILMLPGDGATGDAEILMLPGDGVEGDADILMLPGDGVEGDQQILMLPGDGVEGNPGILMLPGDGETDEPQTFHGATDAASMGHDALVRRAQDLLVKHGISRRNIDLSTLSIALDGLSELKAPAAVLDRSISDALRRHKAGSCGDDDSFAGGICDSLLN